MFYSILRDQNTTLKFRLVSKSQLLINIEIIQGFLIANFYTILCSIIYTILTYLFALPLLKPTFIILITTNLAIASRQICIINRYDALFLIHRNTRYVCMYIIGVVESLIRRWSIWIDIIDRTDTDIVDKKKMLKDTRKQYNTWYGFVINESERIQMEVSACCYVHLFTEEFKSKRYEKLEMEIYRFSA